MNYPPQPGSNPQHVPSQAGFTQPGFTHPGSTPAPTTKTNVLGVISLLVAIVFNLIAPLLRVLLAPSSTAGTVVFLYTLLPLLAGVIGGIFGLLGVLSKTALKYRWMAISGLTLASVELAALAYSQLVGWLASNFFW